MAARRSLTGAQIAEAIQEDEAPRETWTSRTVFLLAAVGSAVGLGNLWRFPALVNRHGGFSFLIAYFLSLVLIGMPLLTQELALGQKFRGGDIEAFGRMSPRLRGIGLSSIFGSFVIICYYNVIIAYSVVFLFESMQSNLPYDDGAAKQFFDDTVLNTSASIADSSWDVSWRLILAVMAVWVIVFFCIFKGIKSEGWVVRLTVPLPIILLVVLMIKGMTLSGAGDGIEQFIWKLDADKLQENDIWTDAVAQVFFSIGVCFGVMTAYSSYNPPDQNVAADEKTIAICDLAVAFMAGFAVYAILGHLEQEFPKADGTSWYDSGGFGLVFIAFPEAIGTFQASHLFGIVLFITLVTLGLDSAFSLLEAVATVITDSDLGRKMGWTNTWVATVLSLIGFCFSFIYCFDSGQYWLDIVDRAVNNYTLLFVGALEAFAVGWIYRINDQYSRVGRMPVVIFNTCYWVAVIIGITLGFALPQHEGSGNFSGGIGGDSVNVALPIAGVLMIAGLFVSDQLAQENHPELTLGQRMWGITGWWGPEDLRLMVNTSSEKDRDWLPFTRQGEIEACYKGTQLGIYWGFLIKYFIPTVLCILFTNTVRLDIHVPYGGYERKHLALIPIVFFTSFLLFAVPAVFPHLLAQDIDNIIEKRKSGVQGTQMTAVASGQEDLEKPVVGAAATSLQAEAI